MNKVKILVIAVVILLASNVFFLVKMLSHDDKPERKTPKDMIIQKLNFDDKQIKEYEALIDAHRSKIGALDKQIIDAKLELYMNMDDANDQTRGEDFEALTTYLLEVEKLHYQHFLDIKKLCRPDQISQFEELSLELPQLFSPPKAPRPPRRE